MQQCFLSWIRAISALSEGEVIAIDGKKVRRSYDMANGKGAIHRVSAWTSANCLVLGQQKVNEKSNEITAIPSLLQVLAIEGCIISPCKIHVTAALLGNFQLLPAWLSFHYQSTARL